MSNGVIPGQQVVEFSEMPNEEAGLEEQKGPDFSGFGEMLRGWRTHAHMSQQDLALASGVSSRHLSFLETGRARPSRKMVLRLSESLGLPLRVRNNLLVAADYDAFYSETELGDESVAQAAEFIAFQLGGHDPYPAFAVDGRFNIVQMNQAAFDFLKIFTARGYEPTNWVELIIDQDGLRPYVENWHEVTVELLRQVHQAAAVAGGDPELDALLGEIIFALEEEPQSTAKPRKKSRKKDKKPFVTFKVGKGDIHFEFFSAVTQFAAPQDITLEELRIESFYPSTESARETYDLLLGRR